MKTINSIFLILLFTLSVNAQNNISFEVGARFRITPIYLKTNYDIIIDERPMLIQQDSHLSGLATVFGINGSLSQKLSFNYRAAVRYDEFYADLSNNTAGPNAYIKRVFLDHNFSVLAQLKEWERAKLSIGFGFSSNNHNSDYSYTVFRRDPVSGDQVRISTSDDFRFSTFDLPIRYQRSRFIWDLTGSITNKHRFFLQKSRFVLLQLTTLYTIPLKKE